MFLEEALFVSEPRVDMLNDLNLQTISDTAWFLNENTQISGNLTFGQVKFERNVDVKVCLSVKDIQ